MGQGDVTTVPVDVGATPLFAQASLLAPLFEGLSEGVTVQSPDGRVIYASPSALRQLGFADVDALRRATPQDLAARWDVQDEHGRPLAPSDLPARQVLQGAPAAERAVRFLVRDTGEERWSLVRASPLRDASGRVCAAVSLFRDVTAERRAQERQAFLSEASVLLSRSLDHRAVLSDLARLAVPRLADGCALDLVADDGRLEEAALVHADPAKEETWREIRRLYPPAPGDAAGVAEVARTGRSFLARAVSRESLEAAARDARHFALLLDTEPRSSLLVPLRTRGRAIGVLSLVLSGAGARRFGPEDVAFCEELALRAAVALDNALLHAEAAASRARLEEIVDGLRESEARYRFLAEAIPLHVWTATPEGALDYVNDRAAAYFGRDPEELLGKGWQRLVHPDDLPGVLARWARALESGTPYEAELRLRRASDATYRWHIGRALPLKDGRGALVKWFGTHFDVEDLKAADGRVRLQKSLLSSQMEAVLDGVALVGNDHRIVTHNRQFARLWGLPEGFDAPASDVLPLLLDRAADPAAFLAGVERLRLAPAEPVRDEVALKDGRILERYGAAILDADGGRHGRVWTFRDISDRKRADETLKRLIHEVDAQRERLDTIVRSVPGVVWEAWGVPDGGSQRIGFVSEHVETMLGYTTKEWLATPNFWLTLVHPEDAERAARESRAHFESGRGGTVQFRWRRKDGAYLWVQAWNTILLDAAGKPVGMRGVTMDATSLRNAEEGLRESEARFRRAFSEASIGMVIKEPDGRLVEANPVFARMLGATPEEIAGRDFSSLTHPEDTELSREMMTRLVAGEAASVAYEKRYLRKDGQVVWAHVTSSVVRDRDGAPLHIVAQIQDVTARKAVEEELRYQTELVRTITDNAGSALFMVDAAGRPIFMNPAATAMTGYASVEEIGDRPLHDAVHFKRPDGSAYPMDACPIDRANAESRPLKGQREVFCRKDGSLFPVAVNVAPIVKDGTPRGAVVEARDVTEEERRERALREHARTLATLNRVNTRLAAELDLDRLVQTVIDAATELTGARTGAFYYDAYDEGGEPRVQRAVSGAEIGSLPWPSQARAADALGPAFRSGRVLRIDDAAAEPRQAALGLAHGAEAMRSVLAVPVVSRSGPLIGGLLFVHPEPGAFTEQAERFALGIAAQAAIALDNASLYRSVQARAEELARLADALERSNRELDQFAYVTSHDLKAPLRGIANLSRWIEEDLGERVTHEARAHLDLLRGRVHRMEALIDAILDYSRVGRRRGRVETVDARRLLEDVVDLLAPPQGATVRVPEAMPTLRTERARLQQVFMNLIGNALKHHPDREKAVVEVGVEDAGAHWRFHVADNGRGIPKRFHGKVFAIFQTLEARDKVEGTGIGLAIVKKVVESKGGRVELESDEGRGATFRFTWPKDEPGGD